MMIVTEHIIKAIVDTIPAIQINENVLAKAQFHWGDEKELNRYIQLKNESAYPLIWLLPSEDAYAGNTGQEVLKECEFVISTRETRQALFNNERYVRSFDTVLQPLTEYLIHGLTVSSITERVGAEWSITKFPNYSAASEENATIDLWDAMRLSINVRFNGHLNCLNTINYGS